MNPSSLLKLMPIEKKKAPIFPENSVAPSREHVSPGAVNLRVTGEAALWPSPLPAAPLLPARHNPWWGSSGPGGPGAALGDLSGTGSSARASVHENPNTVRGGMGTGTGEGTGPGDLGCEGTFGCKAMGCILMKEQRARTHTHLSPDPGPCSLGGGPHDFAQEEPNRPPEPTVGPHGCGSLPSPSPKSLLGWNVVGYLTPRTERAYFLGVLHGNFYKPVLSKHCGLLAMADPATAPYGGCSSLYRTGAEAQPWRCLGLFTPPPPPPSMPNLFWVLYNYFYYG